MRILDKQEISYLLWKAEPDRFDITISPWDSVILIDRWFEYYDSPPKE